MTVLLGHEIVPAKINQRFIANFYPDNPSDFSNDFLYDGLFFLEANCYFTLSKNNTFS